MDPLKILEAQAISLEAQAGALRQMIQMLLASEPVPELPDLGDGPRVFGGGKSNNGE